MAHTLSSRIRIEAEPTKGSRFLATAAPVTTEVDARAFLADVSSEFPDASHHCWAWRIARPAIERAGDDGEPGGSAGRPMLSQLVGRDLVDAAVVVTRWFGGTKLGVGGLVRAYGGAAGLALDRGASVPWVELIVGTIEHTHDDLGTVERLLEARSVSETSVEWGTTVVRTVMVPENELTDLCGQLEEATAGRVTVEPLKLPQPDAE